MRSAFPHARGAALAFVVSAVLLALPGSSRGEFASALDQALPAVAAVTAVAVTSGLAGRRTRDKDAALSGPRDRRVTGTPAWVVVAYLACVAGASLFQVTVRGAAVADAGRALLWFGHPNLLAASVLVPATFVLVAARYVPGLLAVLLASLTVLATGSRSAALGLAVSLLFIAVTRRRSGASLAALHVTLFLGIVFASLVATRNYWVVRFLPDAPSHNLLRATEDLGAGPWTEAGASAHPVRWRRWLGLQPLEFVVRKDADDWWSRVQQAVTLDPSAVYTAAAEFRAGRTAAPGLHGISRGNEYAMLRVEAGIVDGERSVTDASAGGAITIVETDVTQLRGGWWRLSVTFRVDSASRLSLNWGPTPHQQPGGSGTDVMVRALALNAGTLSAYAPTYLSRSNTRASTGTLAGRLSYFHTATAGFRSSPITGLSEASFRALDESLGRERPVAHAHDLVLQTMFTGGIVGLAGLLTLLVALVRIADYSGGAVIAAAMAANLFDYSFPSLLVGPAMAVAVIWLARGRKA